MASGLLLSVSAKAQIVTSIQFADGNPLSPSTVAGVDGTEANWNVVNLTGNQIFYNPPQQAYTQSASTGLITSTGAPSSIGYSVTDGGGTGGNGNGLSGGDNTLLLNGAATYGVNNQTTLGSGGSPTNNWYGAPVTLTLNNLNPNDTYSFIAYLSQADGNLSQGSLALSSGGIQYFTSANGGFSANTLTSYASFTSPTDIGMAYPNSPATAANFQSNYIEFDNITGVTSDTLTLTELGSYPYGTYTLAGQPAAYNNSFGNTILGLSGVQVFDTVAAPEPSTWAMMVGGIVALGFISRRRNARV